MKILIGTPTYDRRIDIELVRAIINLERNTKHEFDYLFPVSSHISRNRNYICQVALEGGYDAILFLDSDIGIVDPGFVDSMLKTAYDFDAKIVGGAYRMKKEEREYVAGEFIMKGQDVNLIEIKEKRLVDFTGTGIMLVFSEVLRALEEPYFTILDKKGLEVLPEDYLFCKKAQEKGFKIAIDPTFETKHYGAYGWHHVVK